MSQSRSKPEGSGDPGVSSQKRRVLVIIYDSPPSLQIGAQTCSQLARYLPLYGWEPVILTVDERYFPIREFRPQPVLPGRVIRTRVLPHPLELYARAKLRLGFKAEGGAANGQPNGTLHTRDIGTLRRWILSLLKTPDEYTGWIPPAVIAGLREIQRQRISQLFSSAPYCSGHLIGFILSILTGLKWTAHYRDPWTGVQQTKPECSLSRVIEAALERAVVSRATSVVCVTDSHANFLRQAHPGASPEKFVTIPNGYDEAEWTEIPAVNQADQRAVREKFVILYCGSMYQWWDPAPFLRALRALTNSGQIDRSRVTVSLVGWCGHAEERRLRLMAEKCGVETCLTFVGLVGRTESLRRLVQADLLLLVGQLTLHQIPGKTYEYLRADRPILALSSGGALAQFLRETGGAWVVDPADENGIANAVREAYRCWWDGTDGPRADRTAVAAFDRRLLAGRFAQIFDGSAGTTPLPSGRSESPNPARCG